MRRMTNRPGRILAGLMTLALAAGLLLGVNTTPSAAQSGVGAGDSLNRPQVVVAQIYFHDAAERDKLAAQWGADEVDTARGFITVWTDRPTYDKMVAAGLRVEINQLTTQRANDPLLFGHGNGTDSFFSGYRTVEEMQSYLDQYVTNYPTLATKVDVGDSWCKVHAGSCTRPSAYNGYDLWALHITNQAIPGPKPVFWYDAGIHSREIATPEVAMRFIAYLLDNYNTNADAHWLVDYHDIWVMPMLNPDGHHIVEAGGGGSSPYYQRKNANNTNGCNTWPPSSSNQFGTDLNRNYPFQWGAHGGSSGSPCTQTYRGPSPNEVEVAAVTAKIRTLIADQNGSGTTETTVAAAPLNATGVIQGMHSYARLDLYPWGGVSNTPPNGADLANMGAHMAATNANPPGNGYTAESGLNLYATDGTSDDWGYGELGVPAFTTELSDDGGGFFPAYNYTQNTIWPENQGMLLYLSKIARTPYLLARGPDSKSVAVSPTSVAQGTSANLSAVINYNWTGNTYAQNVAAAEYYVDTPPWAGGTAIAMSGSFTSQTVNVSATVDSSGLSVGKHIIYVRGRGVNSYSGNLSWGTVSAVFLTVTGGGGPTNTPTNTPIPAPTNTPTNTPVGPTSTPTPTPPPAATVTPTPGSSCSQVVANGGFESGNTSWSESSSGGYEIVDTTRPHSGTKSAYLAGYNNGNDQIWQTVTIPAGSTTATLAYYRYITTQETSHPWDFFYAKIRNSSGGDLTTLETKNDGNASSSWASATFDVKAYAGQTVQVYFQGTTDSSATTSFFVDDVSLNACH